MKTETIKLTATAGALAIGIEPKTLTKRLRAAGIEVRPHTTYSLSQIFRAMLQDPSQARARESNARADLLEIQKSRQQGDLIPTAEVDSALRRVLLPVRQRLLALPTEAAHLCNPSDPQFAHEALTRWVDDALPMIREQVK